MSRFTFLFQDGYLRQGKLPWGRVFAWSNLPPSLHKGVISLETF